jgi:hypothetical protein
MVAGDKVRPGTEANATFGAAYAATAPVAAILITLLREIFAGTFGVLGDPDVLMVPS